MYRISVISSGLLVPADVSTAGPDVGISIAASLSAQVRNNKALFRNDLDGLTPVLVNHEPLPESDPNEIRLLKTLSSGSVAAHF